MKLRSGNESTILELLFGGLAEAGIAAGAAGAGTTGTVCSGPGTGVEKVAGKLVSVNPVKGLASRLSCNGEEISAEVTCFDSAAA